MAQPSGKMSHSVGGGAGVLEGMGRRGMISQTHEYLGAGRREHEPVLPSGRATPPSPPPPPVPGSGTSTWRVLGLGMGMGIRGRGAEWGSSIPHPPPISPGPAPAQALRHIDSLSPQWSLAILPSFEPVE